ncbi:DUF3717 domain-containing protein [Pandoraea sputorum]
MNSTVSITEIEQAINFWLKVSPTGHDYALCEQAAALGNHYGQMIYEKRESVSLSELGEFARASLETAIRGGGR